MNIDLFSNARGKMAVELQDLGEVLVEPGSAEHKACRELVAFGRAFQLPGSVSAFGLERRVGPRTPR